MKKAGVHLLRPRGIIQDIILRVEISHTYVGDLTMRLHYDTDGDGDFDAGTPVDIYLARPGSWIAEELWGCPIELQGVYYFKDDGWRDAGEEATFTVFQGLPAGGRFYLSLTDDGDGNTGTVSSWAVYVQEADTQWARGPGTNAL